MIDVTLESENHLSFRSNLLERIQKPIITNDNKIIDEKLQFEINREESKYLHCPQVKSIN